MFISYYEARSVSTGIIFPYHPADPASRGDFGFPLDINNNLQPFALLRKGEGLLGLFEREVPSHQ
jgi:hypothetical protein